MASIGKVSAVFSASTSGLKAGVSEASAQFRKLGSDVSTLKSRMGTLAAIQGAQLFGSIATSAMSAARGVVGMAKGEAEAIDRTSKLSRQLGMTYGELAGLKLAGDLAGVSMDTIGKAATKADVAFVKASQGSKQAQAALGGVGLSVDELQNKSPAERFQAISDAIAGLPTSAERAKAAVQLFGKSGSELLPLFEGGAGSIRQAADEAQKFGLALTTAQGQDVESMNDAFTRAYASVQGVVQQVTAYLSPAIQSVVDTFTGLIGGIGGANIGQFIGDGIIAGAEFMATIADAVISGLSGVWEYAATIGGYWSTVWEIGNRVAAGLSGVFNVGKVVLGAATLGIGMVVQGLATVAQKIGKFLGFDTSTIDSVVAGAQAFNQSVKEGMDQSIGQAGKDFASAIDGAQPGTPGPPAAPGAISTMLANAVDKAKASRAAVDSPTPPPMEGQQANPRSTTASTEAVKATDSRSKEGVAEMFRLMRGGGEQVQEQQLGVLEQIRDAVSSGDPEELVTFAGA